MFGRKKKKEKPFDPERDTGAVVPVCSTVAKGYINDKFSEYPSEGLTPYKLANIFHSAVEGDICAQMELFEDMEEKDPHLFSQMQTRKLAVTGLDWEIQPFSEDERDKQVAEFISDQLNSLENLSDKMLDMLDAIGKGISVMEIDWGYEDGYNVIKDLTYIHPKKLTWDAMTDELKICTKEYPSGISFPENKFVIHKYKARSGHISRAGLFRVVAWFYMFKNFDIKDWISFCELFGMPLRLGKYGASASEADKRELERALIKLGTDAAGIVPDSTQIEFIESNKTTSSEGYERVARYLDEQISKAVLGQTLTSDSGGGSYAQSKTHNEVRHDLTEHDAKSLAATIRRDIITPLVEYNFGEDANIPFIAFDVSEPEDLKEQSEVYKTLAVDIGLKIPASHVYKKFNIPKPEDGEEILEPPSKVQSAPVQDEETELSSNSASFSDPEEIRQVDNIATIAAKQSEEIFKEMMTPILNLIDKSESLEELALTLKSEDKLKELLQDMESPDLDELLQRGMYLSSLIGGSME